MDWSLAHVRRQRKSVFYGLFIYGCARKAYQSQEPGEASGSKTLASKNEFAALGRFEPSRAERAARSACGILATRRCSADATQKPAARLQVVVARGCPPVGNERHARLLRLRHQQ